MTLITVRGWVLLFASLPASPLAAQPTSGSPQAPSRSHAQNYRDMVLATCLARAYRNDQGATVDAGSSASALRDWTSYDLDDSPDAVEALVSAYLARDYRNPLVESEVTGVRFDFLKCADLYHSKDLEQLVKRVVIDPRQRGKPATRTD